MIHINSLLIAYLVVYLVSSALDLIIDKLNANHLQKCGERIPEAFEGFIDKKELKKISQYTIDNIRFTFVHTSIGKILFLFIILSGILPWLAESLRQVNFVLAGLIFFAVPGLLLSIINLPFDYYHSFVIEERYGFNTKTFKIWIFDLIKSLLVMAVLGTFLLSALLIMVRYAGHAWWLWAWAFFIGFQLLMTILYPLIIAPLFNKFTHLDDPDLKSKIEHLAEKEGISVKNIYKMDATQRTRHTNAYLSGLGKAKRIVLFDSLIQSHTQDEIIAILSHEIGHLKKNHIKIQLAFISLVSLLLFYLASILLTSDIMFESFGFSVNPTYVGFFLVGILWEVISFFLSPIGMAISRRFEREADLYALRVLKTAKPFTTALKKMAKENLSNLRPHPLYVSFNYSHPPLLERIEHLETSDTIQELKS